MSNFTRITSGFKEIGIPDSDTAEMDRFEECAAACQQVGLNGFTFFQTPLEDGSFLHHWLFDQNKPEGRLLNRLYVNAARGVMPPAPDIVLSALMVKM